MCLYFFFKDTATTEIYTYGHTLSLHDALPIYSSEIANRACKSPPASPALARPGRLRLPNNDSKKSLNPAPSPTSKPYSGRSEEHTSELQSLMRISYAVFCLKKKTTPHKV